MQNQDLSNQGTDAQRKLYDAECKCSDAMQPLDLKPVSLPCKGRVKCFRMDIKKKAQYFKKVLQIPVTKTTKHLTLPSQVFWHCVYPQKAASQQGGRHSGMRDLALQLVQLSN